LRYMADEHVVTGSSGSAEPVVPSSYLPRTSVALRMFVEKEGLRRMADVVLGSGSPPTPQPARGDGKGALVHVVGGVDCRDWMCKWSDLEEDERRFLIGTVVCYMARYVSEHAGRPTRAALCDMAEAVDPYHVLDMASEIRDAMEMSVYASAVSACDASDLVRPVAASSVVRSADKVSGPGAGAAVVIPAGGAPGRAPRSPFSSDGQGGSRDAASSSAKSGGRAPEQKDAMTKNHVDRIKVREHHGKKRSSKTRRALDSSPTRKKGVVSSRSGASHVPHKRNKKGHGDGAGGKTRKDKSQSQSKSKSKSRDKNKSNSKSMDKPTPKPKPMLHSKAHPTSASAPPSPRSGFEPSTVTDAKAQLVAPSHDILPAHAECVSNPPLATTLDPAPSPASVLGVASTVVGGVKHCADRADPAAPMDAGDSSPAMRATTSEAAALILPIVSTVS
jgi:hypothetical protein